MPADQYVFDEPEEDFYGPAIGVDRSNCFGGNIKQIRRDAKDAVTVDAARTAAIFSSRCMRIDAHADRANLVVRLVLLRAVGKRDDFVTDDFIEARVVVAKTFSDCFPNTVVAQPAPEERATPQ